MFGSTTPLAERPDLHPVHRANALLRSALLNEAAPFPRAGFPQAFNAIAGPADGSVGIAYPRSLVARLNALDIGIDASAGLRLPLGFVSEGGAPAEAGDLAPPPELDTEDPSEDAAETEWDELDEGFEAARPQLAVPQQAHMLALLKEFRRRQRQASLLVAGSLAAAFLLTLAGFVLIANIYTPEAAKSDKQALPRSTSIVWQRPEREAMTTASQAAKGEALFLPARVEGSGLSSSDDASSAQVILATSGRRLALAPLLGQRHARYVLLRGLPQEVELSAGQRTASGSWMVKEEEMQNLTLEVGEAASGDYPVDVYLLDSGNTPQARRTLVLRVEPARPHVVAAGFGLSWANALLDAAAKAPAAPDSITPPKPSVLLERARTLLAEGDIAGARLLLFHLAERGESDAAYELARTFDAEMLAKLGASGMDGDPAVARGWYQQASHQGNAKAAERLKILASLTATRPSD
jgi:hypothetical protein